jgi:hypothetical protein
MFMRSDSTARQLLAAVAARWCRPRTGLDGQPGGTGGPFPGSTKAEQARTHFTRLTLRTSSGRWVSQTQSVPYGAQPRLASGTIRSSLFGATDEAGLSDALAIAAGRHLFGGHRLPSRIAQGRHLQRRVYETLTADGEPVAWNEGTGRVLAAEFVNAGRTYHAVWFTPADGRGGYYGAERPEPQTHLPGQPDGVLARHIGLCDALSPAAATLARAPGRGLRRPQGHAGAQRGRRRGRLCRLAKRLWQRRAGAARQ